MILHNFQWNLRFSEFLEIEMKEAKPVGHRVESCYYYVRFTSHFLVLHSSMKPNIFYTLIEVQEATYRYHKEGLKIA